MAYDDKLPSSFHRRTRGACRMIGVLGAAVCVAVSWSGTAQASSAYAYILANAFDFGGGCPACHTNATGGLGTAAKPFGQTMMGLGLKANDTDSLYVSLTALSSSDVDSDGDLIADFDELAADGDPNDPNVFPEGATPVTPAVPTPPTTPSTGSQPPAPPPATTNPSPAPASKDDGGCSLTSHGDSTPSVAAVALLGLVVLARRKRQRR